MDYSSTSPVSLSEIDFIPYLDLSATMSPNAPQLSPRHGQGAGPPQLSPRHGQDAGQKSAINRKSSLSCRLKHPVLSGVSVCDINLLVYNHVKSKD